MNVCIVSTQGIFRDLLASAVEMAGYSVKLILDDFGDVNCMPAEGCLIAYSASTEPEFCDPIRTLRQRCPDLGITLVCPPDAEGELVRQLGLTVNGIIPDDKPLNLVIDALTVVSQGYTLLDRHHMCEMDGQISRLITINAEGGLHMQQCNLSDRERTVLECIRDGHSNKEIARDLSISDSTVKVHMRSIFRKIRVKNRTQAAMWAAQHI